MALARRTAHAIAAGVSDGRADAGLTVAVTGPTGDIGRALMRALDGEPSVGRVIGMARQPVRPRGGRLEEDRVPPGRHPRPRLGRRRSSATPTSSSTSPSSSSAATRRRARSTSRASRNVFEAALGAGVDAAGLHVVGRRLRVPRRQPAAAHRGRRAARLRGLLLLGAEGRARGRADAARSPAPTSTPTSSGPAIVAGADALMLVETVVEQYQLGGRLPIVQRALERMPFLAPVLPDPGVPFQLVHHDDVAAGARRRDRGPRLARHLQPRRARPRSAPRTSPPSSAGGRCRPRRPPSARSPRPLDACPLPAQSPWLHAFTTPVLMDTSRARDELGLGEWRYGAPRRSPRRSRPRARAACSERRGRAGLTDRVRAWAREGARSGSAAAKFTSSPDLEAARPWSCCTGFRPAPTTGARSSSRSRGGGSSPSTSSASVSPTSRATTSTRSPGRRTWSRIWCGAICPGSPSSSSPTTWAPLSRPSSLPATSRVPSGSSSPARCSSTAASCSRGPA